MNKRLLSSSGDGPLGDGIPELDVELGSRPISKSFLSTHSTLTTLLVHHVPQYKRVDNSPRCSGSRWMQLKWTLLRILLLMRRDWVSVLCECLIPIIVVAGSVGLWALCGRTRGDAADYYDPTSPLAYFTVTKAIRSGMCYNASVGTLENMPACNFGGPTPLYCPKGRGIPAGWCYPAAKTIQMGAVGAAALVQGKTSVLPTLDEVVLLQWCNMDDRIGAAGDIGARGALLHGGKLYFAPNTPEVGALVESFQKASTMFPNYYGGTFETVTEAEAFLRKTNYQLDGANWGLIQVNNFTPDSFDVAIRLNESALPTTTVATTNIYKGGLAKNGNEMYLLSGFTSLQALIYNHYVHTVLRSASSEPPLITYTPMPTAEYVSDSFATFGSTFVSLLIVLGYLYPVSQLTKRIVIEKELRLREAMLIMGLSDVIMYSAWFIVYGVQYTVSSLIITILLRVTFFPNTPAWITLFLFLFFSWSAVAVSGMIAALFSKARLSAILSPLIYFVMTIPIFAMTCASASVKVGVLIFSPSAVAIGCQLLFELENDTGRTHNLWTFSRNGPSFLVVYLFLLVDTALYLLLMIYLDRVVSTARGPSRPPFFFMMPLLHWCSRCCQERADVACYLKDGRAPGGVFEGVNEMEPSAVRIEGLRREFCRGGKSFVAVNNLYWTLKEGEIGVLLGQNGAGKSTTIKLMTGMLKPDGGDCFIYGKSIRHDLRGVRQEIGLCPQHNILWPNLTVQEHLEYHAAIKGLEGEEIKAAARNMITALDLEHKANYLSKQLSGDQKRKLSVSIAFVGGSRLVFLDEPTAGMDFSTRRRTWNFLRTMARRSTVLLSTHFMDEADYLGSTVAIMSQGRLQCSGSTGFLKSQLGVGFVLTMSVVAHINHLAILEVIRRHICEMEPLGRSAGEVACRLPMAARSQFPTLLQELEDNSTVYGITAFSMSATTLEEVFLRIAGGEAERQADGAADREVEPGDSDGERSLLDCSAVWNVEIEVATSRLLWMQFRAMMIKRFWNSIRDRRTQFLQIVFPVICVLLAMLMPLVKVFESPAMDLTSNVYKKDVEVPISNCKNYLTLTTPFAPRVTMLDWDPPISASLFSNRLTESYFQHDVARYGGMVCNAVPGAVVPTDLYNGLFYNSSAPHEIGIATAHFFSAWVRQITGDTKRNLRTMVDMMPKTKGEEVFASWISAVMIANIIMIPFSFIPSNFVGFIVRERESKAHHLQNISGLSFYIYWLANFVFDAVCCLITMVLVITVLVIFHRTEYISSDSMGPTIVSMLLYSVSGILMAYAVSFFFVDHTTAQHVVLLTNFILGFLPVLAVSALIMADSGVARRLADILPWIFRLFPSYCMGEALVYLSLTDVLCVPGRAHSSWDMHVVGWPCVYMAAEIPLYLFTTWLINDAGHRQRIRRLSHNVNAEPEVLDDGEEGDVVAERNAILTDPARVSDVVRVQHLRMVYSNGKVAVRDLTFGVRPGEVFGFLGTNGAGKTTTTAILCQEFPPTSGKASICGHDIVKSSKAALHTTGYCPQSDACLDLLTVEEHLYLYAAVRGIVITKRDAVVESLMKFCKLTKSCNTRAHQLSGGDRRKLSFAIALIGGPRVLFLDEPSSGMDPVARRGLWNAIEAVSNHCSIVLTTQNLAEVEALTHSVAIMVDGTLRCIGNKAYLKQKYGAGVEVTIRVRCSPSVVHKFFLLAFKGSRKVDERGDRFVYQLNGSVQKLSVVFRKLEENQRLLRFSDYSVSRTSIEHVFMRISEEAELRAEEEQLRKEDEDDQCCRWCRC